MSLTSQIEFHEVENNSFLVQHRSSNKYVKMGKREAEFLKLITAEENLEHADFAYDGDLNEEERMYLATKFKEWGFLDNQQLSKEEEALQSKRKWRFNWKIDDLTAIKFLTVNPDQWLTGRMPVIRKLVHPVSITIYLVLILLAGFMLANDTELTTRLNLEGMGFGGFITIYGMILLTTAFHEVAHGMVCKYYGGRVKQMGAMLFYFNMAMFCDVSDTYVFKKKRHKLAVLFAGIFSQWIMSSIAVLIYYGLMNAGVENPLLLYYGIANIGLSIMNMIPLVKLDGYWMLSHGLGIVNLRTKAFRAIFQFITPWSRRVENHDGVEAMSTRDRRILLIYGLATVVFTPCFWIWGLYNVQERLYSFLGPTSFVITAGISCFLLFHIIKFIRTMYVKPISPSAG
jgi:putative peptide zinc metalloprotease protein